MWISQKHYEGLLDDRLKLATIIAEERVYIGQNKVLQTNLDWARVRVSQLERQNAQLIFNLSGVKIEVPEIQVVAPDIRMPNPLTELPSFEDVGDDTAAEMGISHEKDGSVRYGA